MEIKLNLDSIKSKFLKKNNKAKVNNDSGKMKRFLSKISGAFMLPISVMAIAGLFLGVGAAISSNAGSNDAVKVFGKFIQNLGDPVFAMMPLLFAAAIVVAFTEEAGVAVFVAIIGYAVFSALQSPFITNDYGDSTKWVRGKTVGNTTTLIGAHTWKEVQGWEKILEGDVVKGTQKFHFAQLTGFKILFGGAGRDAATLKALVGNSVGIHSMQTSVFGGIVVGAITAWAYNRFHTIKLPTIISFFGGKRFVAFAVILLMVPVVFLFLILWPYIGYGLGKFGEASGKAPAGIDSFVFGFIERSLIPFGLHHVFYAPLWWTNAGGDLGTTLIAAATKAQLPHGDVAAATSALFDSKSASAITQILNSGKSGDSFLWIEASKLSVNTLTLKTDAIAKALGISKTMPVFDMLSGLGLSLGRFMQGKFPFMTMALPAAAAAMIFAAPKENRKVAMGAIIPAAVTSFTTGVTEPIEFTFLFLAPWLFWGFHAVMAGFSFMLMKVSGAHMGMTFSGGFIDMIVYGMIPLQKGTHFWWALVIGLPLIPIYFAAFYFAIKKFDLATPGRGGNTTLFTKKSFKEAKGKPNAQALGIVEGLGGWDNISKVTNCATRLRVDVVDMKKVNEAKLKSQGAVGFMKTSKTHIQCIFGPQVESIAGEIKRLPKTTKTKATK